MNAAQRQLLAVLNGPMTAIDLAHLLGWPIEATYRELVSLEAQNLARVRVDYKEQQIVFRGWEKA